MIIFQFVRKLMAWLTSLVNSILFRMERKTDNQRGYAFGGPKNAKRIALLFLSFVVAMVLATIMIKRGVFSPVDSVIDRETAPGAKLPTEVNAGFDKSDIFRMERDAASSSSMVDCDRIMSNLRIRGTLTAREKLDFDKSCRDKFGKEISAVVDKIVSGEVPTNVVSDIMQNLSRENAGNILKALDNEEVKKTLQSDAGSTVAKNLADLGKLSPKELDKAVAAIRSAPPQFREDVVDNIKAIAKLESAKARDTMLDVLGAARSKEELAGIKEFTDTIAKAKDGEQEIFATAFKKAPDLNTRKSLTNAAKEIIQIPEDDAIRGKLVDFVKMASDLPADKQKQAYDNLANVANIYRTTDDPDIKKNIADAINEARNLDDIAKLSNRLSDLKTAMGIGLVDKDDQIAMVLGKDKDVMDRLQAAAALARAGNKDEAAKILKSKKMTERGLEALRRQPTTDGAPHGASMGDASKDKLEDLIGKKRDALDRKKSLTDKINELLKLGISPTDPRMLDLYKELAGVDDELTKLDALIADTRTQLMQRLDDLKRRTLAEYGAAGVAMPDFEIKLPDDAADKGAPRERLQDLATVKEFWDGDDGESRIRTKKFFKFSAPNGKNVDSQGGLLAQATGGAKSWMVYPPAGGVSGSSGAAREFEMSRTLIIPGILRRIPVEGIPSNKAGSFTIQFEFLVSVANRKTGKIEIPAGSIALCKVKEFENDTGRLSAGCNAVDVGGRDDIKVNLALGDPKGSDGVQGIIIDNRGWQLAGIFLTAFSAGVVDAFSQQFVSPFEQKADKKAQDILVVGAGGGASAILRDVAQKQIDNWSKANTFWVGYDGMLATIKQN